MQIGGEGLPWKQVCAHLETEGLLVSDGKMADIGSLFWHGLEWKIGRKLKSQPFTDSA